MISLVVGKLCNVVAVDVVADVVADVVNDVDDVDNDDNDMREEQDFTSLYTYTLV